MGMVVTLGSLMTDLVGYAARLPTPGETLVGRDFQSFLGGKGCNQAMAARRSGARVALIGRVGDDAYGAAFFPALAAAGIDSAYVTLDPTAGSGVALILIGSETGQNMILALPRANLSLAPADAIRALDALLPGAAVAQADGATILLAQLETNVAAVVAALRHAHARGVMTILNTAPIPADPLPPDLFALVDVLIANELEASALTGLAVTDLDAARLAAQRLLALGAASAVVTLGALGAVWAARAGSPLAAGNAEDGAPSGHGEDAEGRIAPILVPVVDATAAGDAFCGTLAAALASGLPGAAALRRANAAGALAVTRRGALPSLPTAAEIDALLAANDGASDAVNDNQPRL